jgi:hypothetical protein
VLDALNESQPSHTLAADVLVATFANCYPFQRLSANQAALVHVHGVSSCACGSLLPVPIAAQMCLRAYEE